MLSYKNGVPAVLSERCHGYTAVYPPCTRGVPVVYPNLKSDTPFSINNLPVYPCTAPRGGTR